jgi:uncharacterized protein YabN with tetrapyrrole methylase and pyrophosphatase domain
LEADNRTLGDSSLDEMEALWQHAKTLPSGDAS